MNNPKPAVYIITNKRNGALYTGVSSNLPQRIYQHKHAKISGFTHQHNCNQLVYYELFSTMLDAIAREKQIKAGSRRKKLLLIEKMNPLWLDLYEKLL